MSWLHLQQNSPNSPACKEEHDSELKLLRGTFWELPKPGDTGFGWHLGVAHPATPTRLALPKCHQYCSAQHSNADYLGQGKASSDININQNKSACPSGALNLPPLAFSFHFRFYSHFAQPGFAQRYTTDPAPAALLWDQGQSQQTLWEASAGKTRSEALARQLQTSLIESPG